MPSNQDQTGLALAALAACIVQTLGERDATFQKDFEARLADAYSRLRDSGGDHLGAIEILANVREFLKP
ncbi:hypothetical protein [Parvibaculum sp.]|jgi:hypothetical protein|uniref:hypothetical protein n=1 Tax=Parvibaculum sp. TaxID=2024848 RepID=UPI0025F1E0B6|nr:hypothetical protein [Parvibaculum sp.]|tara:strand:+ start:157 stop:363 length:207 start_codon:yes stop_codon:yes gene_type:complete